MAEVDAAINYQRFDLMEHRRVRRIAVGSVDPARRNEPQRRALRQHRADLNRRGMRAQQHLAALRIAVREIEGVVHRAGGMTFRHVERGEVVPVVLDLRPGCHGKAEIGEYLRQFVHHLADRVAAAFRRFRRGEREVDCLGGKLRFQRRAFKRVLAGGKRIGDRFTQAVDFRPFSLPLFRRHPAQRFQQRRNRALLAKRGHPHLLQRRHIASASNRFQQFRLELIDVAHS